VEAPSKSATFTAAPAVPVDVSQIDLACLASPFNGSDKRLEMYALDSPHRMYSLDDSASYRY